MIAYMEPITLYLTQRHKKYKIIEPQIWRRTRIYGCNNRNVFYLKVFDIYNIYNLQKFQFVEYIS